MIDNSSTNRRDFLKLGSTFLVTLAAERTGKLIDSLISIYDKSQLDKFNTADIITPEILFGDYKNTAILPGNTNRHLLAINGGKPRMSGYIRSANDTVNSLLNSLNPTSNFDFVYYDNPKLDFRNHRNILILGGPVASELTKSLCGYEDKKIINPIPGRPDHLPVFSNKLPFPAYFFVGDPESGFHVIDAIRPGENGNPLPNNPGTYSIIYKGETLTPIIRDGKLLSDMLMIIRLPHPLFPRNGYITIIGGMHGYSIKSFFNRQNDSFKKNMRNLAEIVNYKSCFQILIPAIIDANGDAEILWDTKRYGWGKWNLYFDELNANDFLDIPDEFK